MKPAALGLALAVAFAGALRGQGPGPARTFEVADVHPVTRSAGPTSARNGALRDGIYRLRQATMVDLIRVGYGVDADKVTGGPHWLELDRFDLAARVPPGTTREAVRPMLQALLAERFKLVVRQEPKPFPGLALVVAGTPKLKEAAGSGPGTCQQGIDPPTPSQPSIVLRMSCKSTTLASFAEQLRGPTGGGMVVDATGIPGAFDFEFRFGPPISAGGPLLPTASLMTTAVSDALEKSLGLKLEPREHSLPTLFVESVERTPTPNSAAVATAFPSGAEPEFEVAEIKPSTTAQLSRRILPTGQFTFNGATMRMLVALAWLVNDQTQITGPKSLDGPKYDLIAKISSRPIDPLEVDQEEISAMLRKLLVERFHLKVNRRDQVMEAPSLVTSGPNRLTKADPNGRTKCTQGTATRQTTGPVPLFQVTCQNVTLTEFAERMQQFDPGTYPAPIADETGIDGRWDFKLEFTPGALQRVLQQATAAARAGAAAAGTPLTDAGASDPTGSVSLAQAIERQLGLKVQMRRRPVSVVVVESFDEKPTDN